jgi:hypothetical protein
VSDARELRSNPMTDDVEGLVAFEAALAAAASALTLIFRARRQIY